MGALVLIYLQNMRFLSDYIGDCIQEDAYTDATAWSQSVEHFLNTF